MQPLGWRGPALYGAMAGRGRFPGLSADWRLAFQPLRQKSGAASPAVEHQLSSSSGVCAYRVLEASLDEQPSQVFLYCTHVTAPAPAAALAISLDALRDTKTLGPVAAIAYSEDVAHEADAVIAPNPTIKYCISTNH